MWMQNHRNHHRYAANDVAKESGCHCSRKHLKTWFGTSASHISSSCSFGADFDIQCKCCILFARTSRSHAVAWEFMDFGNRVPTCKNIQRVFSS